MKFIVFPLFTEWYRLRSIYLWSTLVHLLSSIFVIYIINFQNFILLSYWCVSLRKEIRRKGKLWLTYVNVTYGYGTKCNHNNFVFYSHLLDYCSNRYRYISSPLVLLNSSLIYPIFGRVQYLIIKWNETTCF